MNFKSGKEYLRQHLKPRRHVCNSCHREQRFHRSYRRCVHCLLSVQPELTERISAKICFHAELCRLVYVEDSPPLHAVHGFKPQGRICISLL